VTRRNSSPPLKERGSPCALRMGWHKSEEIWYMTYGMWLLKNKPEWFEYLKGIKQISQDLINGRALREIPNEPKGWINPGPYFSR